MFHSRDLISDTGDLKNKTINSSKLVQMQVGQERRDEQGSHIAFTVRQLVRENFAK